LDLRIGFGYDVHRLVPGRMLILGGVQVECELGLLGHSDADVLLHAIGDALLGAAALGDLGTHFPDTDPAYAGISSLILLREIGSKLAGRGFRPLNVDATVVAQRPKLAPYVPEMRRRIAEALQVDVERVSVKATTTEGLGFAGRGEGIAAYAIALVLHGGEE